MFYYTNINADQVISAYILFRFLEKLKIIGHIIVTTKQIHMGDDGFGEHGIYNFTEDKYDLIKEEYSSKPGLANAIDEIEKILNKKFMYTI